jgi:hypothetical protein
MQHTLFNLTNTYGSIVLLIILRYGILCLDRSFFHPSNHHRVKKLPIMRIILAMLLVVTLCVVYANTECMSLCGMKDVLCHKRCSSGENLYIASMLERRDMRLARYMSDSAKWDKIERILKGTKKSKQLGRLNKKQPSTKPLSEIVFNPFTYYYAAAKALRRTIRA